MAPFYHRASIRHKVVVQITGLVTLALLANVLAVAFLVREQVTETTQVLMQSQADLIQEQVEQRLQYLLENSELLSSNQLMVNALTDSEGLKTYLPPLIENFLKGKDVLALNIVDYAGNAIFQTQDNLPHYNDSRALRRALAYRETTLRLRDDDHQVEVLSPIEYYRTTQGAVQVVFDLKAIVDRVHGITDARSLRLLHHGTEIYRHQFKPDQTYYTYTHQDKNSLFNDLGVEIELGLPSEVYYAPLLSAIWPLLGLGSLFIVVSALLARWSGQRIVAPILELNRRVKAAMAEREVFCSPLGSHDELEDLAKAFDERTLALQYQAEHDALTELPNRVLFLDRLRQAVKTVLCTNNKLAVLFIDLDRFKEVNDSFGHDTGDALLQAVSDQIGKSLRSSDSVARLGGDEFAVLLSQVDHAESIIGIVDKILRLFREPFFLNHRQIYVSCSIGIVICPDNGVSADTLLRNADAAMYKAKAEGRHNYQFYTEDMTQRAVQRITLETSLRNALRNEELRLYYQVQVDMRNDQPVGLECLVRWQHPDSGMIMPDQFIPLAEETGLIVQIDRWVLLEALRQDQNWREAGLDCGVLSVNLSVVQLGQPDFIGFVEDAVRHHDIAPARLMFEITETAIMRSPEKVIAALHRLEALGFGLALDDFGTGLSSLSYLKQLPVDKLKIDRSFIRDIPGDEEDMRLTQAIIRMAKSLDLQLVAEGVETAEHVAFLVANGCFEAQGYRYHKPSPAAEVERLFRAAWAAR